MSHRTRPPFRADHVGSLIRTEKLIAAREAAESGEGSAHLKRIQEEAIREVVAMQEEIGLKLVTDGEYNRGAWHRDFLLRFENVRLIPSKITVRFHSAEGTRDQAPPSWQVAGSPGAADLVDAFAFSRRLARRRRSHHSLADRDAFPRRARRDRPRGLPRDGGFLRGPRRRLRAGDRRSRGRRLPLSADRRGQSRLSVRSRVARAGEQHRREPGIIAGDLCEAPERHDRGPAGGHDGVHASLPRQLRRRVGRGGRLRAGGRTAVQRDRCRRLFPRIRLRARRGLRAAAFSAEGQDRGAWSRHDEERELEIQGRAEAPHR